MSWTETVAQVCLLIQSVVMGYIGYGHLFKPDGNLSELGFTYKPRSAAQRCMPTAIACVDESVALQCLIPFLARFLPMDFDL